MLEAEMDQKLGYSKYDYQHKDTDDSRNGYSKKTVVSSLGEIDLDISNGKIILQTKCQTVVVYGENLRIKSVIEDKEYCILE